MHDLLQDVKYGLRLIVKNRMLSLAVFLSLSLGIGATASIFSFVDSFLLRPIPVPETSRIIRIASVTESNPLEQLSYPDFDDLRSRAQSFEGMALVRDEGGAITTRAGGTSRITLGAVVTGEFFSALRIQPTVGRAFRPEEDRVPGQDAVALISYSLWQNEYGGSPDVIGKALRINTTNFTIIGVVPKSFDGVNPFVHPEFYVPRMMDREFSDAKVDRLTDRNLRIGEVYARLKPGVALEQARAEVAQIAAQLEQEHPETNRGYRMTAFTQVGARIAEDPENMMASWLFMLVAGLVLGAACVNVANLLLATAPARTREIAMRMAMGASRARLVRQLMVESSLVSIAATLAGLGIADLAARFIRSVEIISTLPIRLNAEVDARVVLFAFAVGLGSGLLSGLIPALRCSSGKLNTLLRSTDTRVGPSRSWVRQSLVVAQVAAAVIVLVLSGLAIRSLQKLIEADPGFRVENVLAIAFDPLMAKGDPAPQAHRFYGQLLARVRAIPGVEAAGLGQHVPLLVSSTTTNIVVDGFAMPADQKSIGISSAVISEGYFDALGIPILRGRAFDAHDTPETPKVALVNEAAAKKYWPNRDPLGARIQIQGAHPGVAQVVGIARTAKYRSFGEEPMPFLYLPLEQSESTFMELFVATKGDPALMIPSIRDAVREVDPNQPMYDIRTMSDTVRRQALWGDRLTAEIVTAVGIIGLALGVLGLYGILAYSVSQRTREIGIRMAVGATSQRVRRMILLHGMKLTGAGIAVGIVLSLMLTSVVREAFTPAEPYDPITYVIVSMVLFGVALLACYLPARRASRVDPNECLRSE